MKLDKLKHLPELTENAFYNKGDKKRAVQEIAELKLSLEEQVEGENSENQVVYVLGLIFPGYNLCDITGEISKDKSEKEHRLISSEIVIELSDGARIPGGKLQLYEFSLSEILEYNVLKRF